MFTGSMVALITPVRDGKVDFQTLDELIAFHLQSSTDCIVPVGTTGECPTLSHEEHKKVIERVVKTVAGKIPVIAGAGSNSTVYSGRPDEQLDTHYHSEANDLPGRVAPPNTGSSGRSTSLPAAEL